MAFFKKKKKETATQKRDRRDRMGLGISTASLGLSAVGLGLALLNKKSTSNETIPVIFLIEEHCDVDESESYMCRVKGRSRFDKIHRRR